MSTDDLGRKQTPAKHNTNAFAMLKKTAVEEAPPTPKPEEDAPPAKKNESSRATTPKTAPKTTTNTQPKARQERAKTPPRNQQPTEEIEQPRTQENPDEAKERPTELVTLYLPLDLREAFKRQAKAGKLPILCWLSLLSKPHIHFSGIFFHSMFRGHQKSLKSRCFSGLAVSHVAERLTQKTMEISSSESLELTRRSSTGSLNSSTRQVGTSSSPLPSATTWTTQLLTTSKDHV